ncbi:MAG: terminase TerL endonuclease subunit, partial [Pseudomonadota bacterium]
ATETAVKLQQEGLPIVLFGQGYASMSPPSKELERLVLCNGFHHGGNPVLRWNAANLAADTDPSGNVKPNKAKSADRIDGCVALIMALGRAMLAPPEYVPGVEIW